LSTDYVGSLIERGRARAEADGLSVIFQEADAENLPFSDASFDVVLSTFGVMFTPNQEQAARELMRVCRPGMANWTPESFVGRLFKIIGKYVPPAPGVKSPALWGNKAYLEVVLGPQAIVAAESKFFVFRYKSPEHWVEVFRTCYGPVLKAFAAIDSPAREALEADLYALITISTSPMTARWSFRANTWKSSPSGADPLSIPVRRMLLRGGLRCDGLTASK
jgi:SAM-dependent methyltransferase